MPRIEDLFHLHTAHSKSFHAHKAGDVVFVTNGLTDNGVLGYVNPLPREKVFTFTGIIVSTFCEATMHVPPFIARGNGGSGLMVLEPRESLTVSQLVFFVGYINTALRWRFSWSRQATVERVRRLEIPEPDSVPISFRMRDILSNEPRRVAGVWRLGSFRPFALDTLYRLKPGDYHNTSSLPAGTTPLVSCGDANNGITSFVTVPVENTYSQRLTIAFNGMNTLTAKYHPYLFAAKDDVAVCTPNADMRPSTQLFIQLMLNRERWRYSYYRKCFIGKLRRFEVALPAVRGKLNQDAMQTIVESAPYWSVVRDAMTA